MRTVDLWQNFEWRVASDGYKWLELRRERLLLVPKQDDGRPLRTRPYRPMARENAGLLSEFANLQPEPGAVLSFANRYGQLGWPVTAHVFGDSCSLVPDRHSFDAGLMGDGVDPRKHYPGQVGEFLTLADNHALNSRTWTAQIRRLAEVTRNHVELTSVPMIAEAIQATVNLALKETVGPLISWSSRSRTFRFQLAPRSLAGALWLQAALALSLPLKILPCPICDTPFEISRAGGARSDAKFCSDKCKSKDQRNRKKKVQNLANKGLSPKQISERLKMDPDTVRRWLQPMRRK